MTWINNDSIRGLPPGIRRVRVETRSTRGKGRHALYLPGRTRASAIVTTRELNRIIQCEASQ